MKIEKTSAPPLGWNSYDCWGVFIREEAALDNLAVFVEKLKPHGYTYFCIDGGWYSEHAFQSDPSAAIRADRVVNHMDGYGRYVAAPRLFPRGLRHLAGRCHADGVKFGVHLMRGIPRTAVDQKLPVLGTKVTAADIADTSDVCLWCPLNYGVDMTKPGAQAYYDSVVSLLAEQGVDFIKMDDIMDYPDEVEAVAKAVAKVNRPMLVSLSPGNSASRTLYPHYTECANMVRISRDLWDTQEDIDTGFERWELWEDLGGPRCWLDLDMIPLGALQVYAKTELKTDVQWTGHGQSRQCRFTPEQKRTFITQRALAAAPLIMGGELTQTSDADLALLTNLCMLACNQNGVVGKRIAWREYFDVRHSAKRDGTGCWIGVFNRWTQPRSIRLSAEELGLALGFTPWHIRSIWEDRDLCLADGALRVTLKAYDVLFLECTMINHQKT